MRGALPAADIDAVLNSTITQKIENNLPTFQHTWIDVIGKNGIDVLAALPLDTFLDTPTGETVHDIFNKAGGTLGSALNAQAVVTAGTSTLSSLVGFMPAAAAGPAGWAAFGISLAISIGKGIGRIRECTNDFTDDREAFEKYVEEMSWMIVNGADGLPSDIALQMKQRLVSRILEATPLLAGTYGSVRLGNGHTKDIHQGHWNSKGPAYVPDYPEHLGLLDQR
jgi:hypothetical protein